MNKAFTLIEILIALTIFAILGILITLMLKNTIYVNQRVNKENQNIQYIEIAQTLLRRDLSQIVDRSITDASGGRLAAFILSMNDLSFTRGGLCNPFSQSNQSNLQRVDYAYKNHALYRYSWPVLDRASLNTRPTSMRLLSHITAFKIAVYDQSNRLQIDWPIIESHDDLPKAIKISIVLDHQGRLDDIIPVVSNGVLGQ